MNDPNYYVKLLNLLIRINGGTIRIPSTYLTRQDVGSGFNARWDDATSELVLESVAKGTTFHEVKAGTSWLNQPLSPSVPIVPQALSQEELLKKAWTQSAATPTVEESQAPSSKRNKVMTITDDSLASAELKRQKDSVMREILDYQPPKTVREDAQRIVFTSSEGTREGTRETKETPSSAIPATFLRR